MDPFFKKVIIMQKRVIKRRQNNTIQMYTHGYYRKKLDRQQQMNRNVSIVYFGVFLILTQLRELREVQIDSRVQIKL